MSKLHHAHVLHAHSSQLANPKHDNEKTAALSLVVAAHAATNLAITATISVAAAVALTAPAPLPFAALHLLMHLSLQLSPSHTHPVTRPSY